ncbi:unnamed protein product [Chrysodeixis includens]|uniref:Scavenger receptor class B member 1 n=1 Tax=Chrysodeixis includens TaxID=689277 RepID=A0A9P0FSG8_CHRIL|nr:unnamed protein product [Chrysodeixis includens]
MGHLFKGPRDNTKLPKKTLLICLVLGTFTFSAAIWTVAVEPISVISKYLARIDYGTLVHQALSRETDSVHISVYLFNVTNPEEFASGEDHKLRVQEIGPFTFQENRTNEDLEIDREAGVMRYTPRHRVTFLLEESVARPEDVTVTMPNLALLSMASAASSYGYFARLGFNLLVERLRSNATVTMSAQDYLWGYDEPLIRLGNQFLPGWINFKTLGLLDRLYDKNTTYRIEINTRDEEKFMIRSINGIGGLKQWGYPETSSPCNSFTDAYEGLGYPPGMSPDRPLKIYRSILCRFLDLEYVGTKPMEYGGKGLEYKVNNRSFSKVLENECLCSKGTCADGVSDLAPCLYGLPVVMSNAHFLDADPSVYERVEGMNPDEELHGSEFTIEPIIGMVLTTKFSVQLNVLVSDVTFNSDIQRYSHMLVPVAYFKIVQPKLPDDQITSVRLMHVYGPYLLIAIQFIFVSSTIFLLSHSLRLIYWNWVFSRRKQVGNKDVLSVKEVLSSEPLMENCEKIR